MRVITATFIERDLLAEQQPMITATFIERDLLAEQQSMISSEY
jgi:hypothetical protein